MRTDREKISDTSKRQASTQGHDDEVRTGLKPVTGSTPDGVPLALNRAPVEGLAPWIGRMMVAVARGTDTITRSGLLCNDAGYVRTAVSVDWVAETADGPMEIRDQTFLCGQHTKAMPMLFTGGIEVAGFMLKPGAMRSLWGVDDGSLVDRIKGMEYVGLDDRELTDLHYPGISADAWLSSIEEWLLHSIRSRGVEPPDLLSQVFEEAAFADPNQSIIEFAEIHNVTIRTLQRAIKRSFGLTPKQVMRRARTLDLATRLCGVADEEEGEEIQLRFFDQSHEIREFTGFFGMTPRQFLTDRQGLLTLSLEIRQARRLELLDRIAPDAVRPWMRDPLRPASSVRAN